MRPRQLTWRCNTMVSHTFKGHVPPWANREIVDSLENLVRCAVEFKGRVKCNNRVLAQFAGTLYLFTGAVASAPA